MIYRPSSSDAGQELAGSCCSAPSTVKQTQITSYVLLKTIENFSYFLSGISLVVPV